MPNIKGSFYADGLALNFTDADVTHFVDMDSAMLGAATPRIPTQDYPNQDGVVWGDSITYEPLEVPITLTVVPRTEALRALYIDKFFKLFTMRSKPMTLQYQPQANQTVIDARTLMVHRSSNISVRRLDKLAFQLLFTLRGTDPFWVGSPYVTTTLDGVARIPNPVATAPLLDAEFFLYGPYTTATITNKNNGQVAKVVRTVPTGSRVVLRPYTWDAFLQTMVNGVWTGTTNVVNDVAPGQGIGAIIDMETGDDGFTVTFTGGGTGTRAQLHSRDWFV